MKRKTGYIKCDWLTWDFALMSLPETHISVDGKDTIHKWDHVEIYLDGVEPRDKEIIEEFRKGRRDMIAHTDEDGVWELQGAYVSSFRRTVVTIEFRSARRIK